MANNKKIKPLPTRSFQFHSGRILVGKYEVMDLLGAGWEGEVYRVREIHTDIIRTAKFFYPQRNERNKALLFYARKLHKLHHCPVVIQYHTQENAIIRGQAVSFLISEFVEGQLLSNFLLRLPNKKLLPYPALHLLHAMASGIESIHALGEYHGDLHSGNIIVERVGLKFDLKLLDLFHWGAPSKANIHDDVCNIIDIFYDSLGGASTYAKHPPEIKGIICGRKRSLILKKFRSAGQLKIYLENMVFS